MADVKDDSTEPDLGETKDVVEDVPNVEDDFPTVEEEVPKDVPKLEEEEDVPKLEEEEVPKVEEEAVTKSKSRKTERKFPFPARKKRKSRKAETDTVIHHKTLRKIDKLEKEMKRLTVKVNRIQKSIPRCMR